MVQYKFLYGDGRGLGEPARILFAYADVKFEDVRLNGIEEIDKVRDELPFGQVPLLIIDDEHKIAQSYAIFRYLGRKFGLSGKTEIERAQVDALGDFVLDLYGNCKSYIFHLYGRGEGDKEVAYNSAKVAVEKWSKILDKTMADSKSGFLAKSGVTWPDFVAANFYENWSKKGFTEVAEMKNLKKIHDNVKALPQLKNYFATRKLTEN